MVVVILFVMSIGNNVSLNNHRFEGDGVKFECKVGTPAVLYIILVAFCFTGNMKCKHVS